VGFKRQEDLARAVGTSRQHLVKWLRLASPPRRMRKGFDQSLASALQTTTHILFSEYATKYPEEATFLELPRVAQPWEEPRWREMSPPERAAEIANLLSGDDGMLKNWLLIGEHMAAALSHERFDDAVKLMIQEMRRNMGAQQHQQQDVKPPREPRRKGGKG
jgi:hypothetical protein